jgi:hypothetical protein
MPELLHGGKADNVPSSAFPAKKLREGMKVEREHTSNRRVTEEIAKDHLSEDMDYYEKLKKMEKKAGHYKDPPPSLGRRALEFMKRAPSRRELLGVAAAGLAAKEGAEVLSKEKKAMMGGFFDEMEKISKSRYEKEVQKGTIRRSDVVPGAMNQTGNTLGIPGRMQARRALQSQTPVSPEQLAKSRTMSSKLYNVDAAHPENMGAKGFSVERSHFMGGGPMTLAMGPHGGGSIHSPPDAGRFIRGAIGGPVGMLRAVGSTLPNAPASLGVPSVPMDRTLGHAILRHEGGEAATARTGKARMLASHMGVRPLLEEQMATRKDPEAAALMGRLRQSNPDDALITKRMKQMGALPGRPLPIGGKAERKLNAGIDANPGALTPKARAASLNMGAARGGFQAPYVPQEASSGMRRGTNLVMGAGKSLEKGNWGRALKRGATALRRYKPALNFVRKGVV